jgi:hypothetical protein
VGCRRFLEESRGDRAHVYARAVTTSYTTVLDSTDPTPTTGSRELDNYENSGRMEGGYQAIHAVSLPGRWSAWRDRRRLAKAKARAMIEHADRKKTPNT